MSINPAKPKNALKCNQCGSNSEILYDEHRGLYFCSHCASICSDFAYTSDQFFDKKSLKISTNSNITSYSLLDKEKIRKQKVHNLLYSLGLKMNMPAMHIDEGIRLFEIAQENFFTRGRISRIVAAAILYIICRKEKAPYLLIDFCDNLQIGFAELVSCYIRLKNELRLNAEIPQLDPSLFIHRFCAKLEFGESLSKVSFTALRLMQSFKRDWITQGRAPGGLCGAAIMIAASMHGFHRSPKQIIGVIKVCASTLLHRLEEFKTTPIANLTSEEFKEIDFSQYDAPIKNPPSFDKRKDIENPINSPKMLNDAKMQKKLENALVEMENEEKKVILLENLPKSEQAKYLEQVKENTEEINKIDTKIDTKIENSECDIKDKEISNKNEIIFDSDNDIEINQYILNEKEVALKTALWESINNDWVCKNNEKKSIKNLTKSEKMPRKLKKKKIENSEEITHPVEKIATNTKMGKNAKSCLKNLLEMNNNCENK